MLGICCGNIFTPNTCKQRQKESYEQSSPSTAYVLDIGTLIAGPFGATILGDFGAEVIKVEQRDA